jgi:hypothetical protein
MDYVHGSSLPAIEIMVCSLFTTRYLYTFIIINTYTVIAVMSRSSSSPSLGVRRGEGRTGVNLVPRGNEKKIRGVQPDLSLHQQQVLSSDSELRRLSDLTQTGLRRTQDSDHSAQTQPQSRYSRPGSAV